MEIGYLEQNDDVFLFLSLRKLIYIKEVVLNIKYKMKLYILLLGWVYLENLSS